MNWVEMVLFTTVCTGMRVPCLTSAWMLFCVISRGLESTLAMLRVSAALKMTSRATFAQVLPKSRAELGAPGKFVTSGCDPAPPLEISGGGTKPGPKGLASANPPPTTLRRLPVPAEKARLVPSSRVKARLALTTRASISTCSDLRSSCLIRSSIRGITVGMSRMIRVLVRLSRMISPREERKRLRVGSRSFAWA